MIGKFPKIKTLFKRDEKTFKVTPFIREDDTILALTYLNTVRIEEKIDGTNGSLEYCNNAWGEFIDYHSKNNRIEDCLCEEGYREFGMPIDHNYSVEKCERCKGRGYNDIMFIRETLEKIVDLAKLRTWYKANFKQDEDGASVSVNIYGEVFGEKIQKNLYTPKGVRDFRVFDIRIGNSWLSPIDRDEVCKKIGLKPVPTITISSTFPTYETCRLLLCNKTLNKSLVAKEYERDSILEGYILRPPISLTTNKGRAIGKIKVKDFK